MRSTEERSSLPARPLHCQHTERLISLSDWWALLRLLGVLPLRRALALQNDMKIANLRSRDVTPDEAREFLKIRQKRQTNTLKHRELQGGFVAASREETQEAGGQKEETLDPTLESFFQESIYSGSDTSSICASSGSPPGSSLAGDDMQDWACGVAGSRKIGASSVLDYAEAPPLQPPPQYGPDLVHARGHSTSGAPAGTNSMAALRQLAPRRTSPHP
ncbi:hypothetical protein FB451DRAFT_1559265 [Mycena latifolia]|nr:hypothetical protein FB451DRAFT_1559265 [Mycena latifolia]